MIPFFIKAEINLTNIIIVIVNYIWTALRIFIIKYNLPVYYSKQLIYYYGCLSVFFNKFLLSSYVKNILNRMCLIFIGVLI